MYMVQQARSGRQPDFKRPERLAQKEKDKRRTTNAGALDTFKALGVKIR